VLFPETVSLKSRRDYLTLSASFSSLEQLLRNNNNINLQYRIPIILLWCVCFASRCERLQAAKTSAFGNWVIYNSVFCPGVLTEPSDRATNTSNMSVIRLENNHKYSLDIELPNDNGFYDMLIQNSNFLIPIGPYACITETTINWR